MKLHAHLIALAIGLGSTASAAPRYPHPPSAHASDPAIARAEALWIAADKTRDPLRATRAWQTAAAAFDAIAADTHADLAVRTEAAYTTVLAWKNAIDRDPRVVEPGARGDGGARPFDANTASFVAAITRFVVLAPTAPDAVGLRFLRGNLHRRFGHDALAEADFVAILDDDRGAEVAEYAANLLLDLLNREQRYDDLIRWVHVLRADAPFMKAHPDLSDTLARIDQQWQRHQAAPH
ncbi:MAG: hypothetical protein K8W52_08505 [Deltaproteobacteria bacterium]|nr:hypothetical protein [Deltaproteobacteria bacterium]